MGNATTWPFPVLYRIVKGATPESVVLKGAAGLLPNFIEAAAELVRHGAEAITTNCGFLSLFQKELAAQVKVPVATSALLQVPWVQATLPPGKRVGVITVSAPSLTPGHLEAAGVPLDTPFVGTEKGREFFRVLILGEKDDMDVARPSRISSMPAARWSRRIPRSAPSCSNAPTCRPMPRRCARRWACRSTTSTR